jgi:SAM-dependent methyltransferase
MRNEMRDMYISDLTPGRLLDVGCGNGLFLKRMSDLGWIAQGVETDTRSARVARETYGFEVYGGTLQDAGFPADSFDAITMSHVIEHLRDPLLVLAECRRILKPGGVLVVTTPNYKCLGHRCFGRRWLGLDPPRHLYVFSRKSLDLMANRTGFSRPKTRTSAARADMIFHDMIRIQTGQLEGALRRGWYIFGQAFLLLELAVISILPDAGEDLALRVRK